MASASVKEEVQGQRNQAYHGPEDRRTSKFSVGTHWEILLANIRTTTETGEMF